MPPPCKNRPSDVDLRRMYLDERLPAQAIADLAGVRKITALRWLRAAGIERRPAQGLANRGVEPPSADDLRRMIHVEHLGYREVADRYGVDHTAVPYWLDKHGIPRPKIWVTRRKGIEPPVINGDDVVDRYRSGEGMVSIADSHGASEARVRAALVAAGVPIRADGWQRGWRIECADGHQVRSHYEQRVDNWLARHGVVHGLEPAYPWDRRFHADFLVGSTYIEVWGVMSNPAYIARKELKIQRCREEGLTLLQIHYWQFAQGRKWWKPLLRLI